MDMHNKYQFIGCESDFDASEIVLFGAPYDGTSSYRAGSRFAPFKIRFDSYGLETFSPYSDSDLTDKAIHDAGDLEFPYGNSVEVLKRIRQFADIVLKDAKKPFMIGGEHLVSLPVIEALHDLHPNLHIIHFDAHTDLREHYLGEPLSHATVIRKAWDKLGDNRIFQFGIRSGTKEEFQWAEKEHHVSLHRYNTETLDQAVLKIGNNPVYITIDLDVLDPSIFSGTGTPEPGGISFVELIQAIRCVSTLNIVGADVVELSPDYDASGVSTAVASKVIRELLLAL